MQRFKKYIGKDLILKNVKDSDALLSSGFICNNLPDSMGDFEELEFSSDLRGQPLLMCVAVLTEKVKRIMFVVCNREDPDDVRPLSQDELKDFLDQKGDQLVNFFDGITRG